MQTSFTLAFSYMSLYIAHTCPVFPFLNGPCGPTFRHQTSKSLGFGLRTSPSVPLVTSSQASSSLPSPHDLKLKHTSLAFIGICFLLSSRIVRIKSYNKSFISILIYGCFTASISLRNLKNTGNKCCFNNSLNNKLTYIQLLL